MSTTEPRNPFYFLLLLVSLLFAVTALAVAVVPTLEQRAADAGQALPPSELRDLLRSDGWKWLLYELAALVLFALLSMGLDRLRSLQNPRPEVTISETESPGKPGG